MKRRLFSDLGKTAARTGRPTEEQRRKAAERHHLKVVEGKIPLPDLRIEYQTPDGRETRVDLELATDHYRPGQMAQAGFKIYSLGQGILPGLRPMQPNPLRVHPLPIGTLQWPSASL